MILEVIMFFGLFHHKPKPTPLPAPVKQDEAIAAAMDTIELNANTLAHIEKHSSNLRFEYAEIKAAEDAALACENEKDRTKFLENVEAFDHAVDVLLVEDEMFDINEVI